MLYHSLSNPPETLLSTTIIKFLPQFLTELHTQSLCGLAPPCPIHLCVVAFDVYNGVPSKEITQPLSFQGANRQSVRRVPLMWLELKWWPEWEHILLYNSDQLGTLRNPRDSTIEANNRATMAETGHQSTHQQKGEYGIV